MSWFFSLTLILGRQTHRLQLQGGYKCSKYSSTQGVLKGKAVPFTQYFQCSGRSTHAVLKGRQTPVS